MAEPLLSDLCKICTNNTPKYCCPRCNARTCSLPCYKRHKLWAQCSGKRDPTAFVSRSHLATPAGIDHDYNFLTGIERSLGVADRPITKYGISLEGGNEAYKSNPASRVAKYLDESGAVIIRAPKGMSRQKNNRTQYNAKRKCIMWTVEWVHPDGARENASCRENIPLSEGYKLCSSGGKTFSGGKRKRLTQEMVPDSKPMSQSRRSAVEIPEVENTITSQDAENVESNFSHQPGSIVLQDETNVDLANEAIMLEVGPISAELSSKPEDSATVSDSAEGGSNSTISFHFYLHKPLTPTRAIILIPLVPSETLSVSLRNRVILEYPTIYVMNNAPSDLPDGFRLESELPRMIQELEDEAAGDGDEAALFAELDRIGSQSGKQTQKNDPGAEWEDRKVLESLRRDLEVATREVF